MEITFAIFIMHVLNCVMGATPMTEANNVDPHGTAPTGAIWSIGLHSTVCLSKFKLASKEFQQTLGTLRVMLIS